MDRPVLQSAAYFQRIQKMQELIQQNDYDMVIIASDEAEPANVRYFTGYVPVFETVALLVPAVGEAKLLIGPEGLALAKRRSKLQNFRKLLEFRESSDPEYPDITHASFESVLSECENKRRIGLIGGNVMTVQVYQGILDAANGAEVIRCDALLRSMRMIKSPDELEMMRYSARIAERGFRRALQNIQPGMTEHEVVAECIHAVLMEGAEGTGFPFWCVAGSNSNQAIGMPTFDRIASNEIIQISMGAMYEGYVTSYGRPFCFGKPSEMALRLMRTGLAANKLTHGMIRSEVQARDIAVKVQSFIREAGFEEYIVYGPAHGNGMMECEYPFIESTSDYLLQPGMTFAVDTFLGGGDFGIRYEDAVAVTVDGEETFSDPQEDVIIL